MYSRIKSDLSAIITVLEYSEIEYIFTFTSQFYALMYFHVSSYLLLFHLKELEETLAFLLLSGRTRYDELSQLFFVWGCLFLAFISEEHLTNILFFIGRLTVGPIFGKTAKGPLQSLQLGYCHVEVCGFTRSQKELLLA